MVVMRSLAGAESNPLQHGHQPQRRFGIPQDLPASISQHVIPVTEPDDIFRDFQSRRERNYHLLIRRFVYQILYGCTNPACKTPTCLSYQKRTTKVPLRKLTPLSARTLACYLASESNPEAALCPNCPQVFPEHETQPAVKRRPRGKSHNVTFESDEKEDSNRATRKVTANGRLPISDIRSSRPGVLISSSRDPSNSGNGRTRIRDQQVDERWGNVSVGTYAGESPTRDTKSFTQSLFETLPLRMLEWLPFRPRPGNQNDTQYHSTPQRYATESENSAIKKSKDTRESLTRETSQIDTIPAMQDLSRRLLSDDSRKRSDASHQTLPKGDAWNIQKDGFVLEAEHVTRNSVFNTAKIKPTDSAERLPVSISVPDETESSHPGDSSLTLSVEMTPELGIETVSEKPIKKTSDSLHDVQSTQKDDPRIDTDDKSPLSKTTTVDKDASTTTYTLEKVSWQTFTDLRLMQATLEKECLGYRLTNRRPWPDDAKALPDHALRFSDWTAFVKQSCFYLLKDSSRLARAFKWDQKSEENVDTYTWPTSILPIRGLEIFGALYHLRPSEEILQFLSHSLDQVFLSTHELMRPPRSQTNRGWCSGVTLMDKQSVGGNGSGLSDRQAAFVLAVILYAIGRFSAISHRCSELLHADICWRLFCRIRSFGRILPADFVDILEKENVPDCHLAHLQCLVDVFQCEIALDLVSKLAKAISNRLTFSEISNARAKQESSIKRQSVLQFLIEYLKDFSVRHFSLTESQDPALLSSTTLEWLRTILLRDWNGHAVVRRQGAIGGALQMLAAIYEDRVSLRLDEKLFHTPFFAERFDSMEMPVEWLSYRPDNKTFHLLSFSFLFPPSSLVTYFRALNFATMSKSFETALITSKHVSQFTRSGLIQGVNTRQLSTTMRPAVATYLVLNVRRDSVLTDAIDQLWRRQKRELMRPLKVRMGMDEGEEGVDHGGVQQEFFRCLFAEALDPSYGMFTIDERTKMTWFQPCSLEPLYKFEMLGILFSIAVYNSITLPVTFPLAFYRKLLDLHVKKLDHIQDGWPGLAKGLQEMLNWSEGDVGDIFMRTYEFSFDAFGEHVDVDMQKISRDQPWPSPNQQNKSTRKSKSSGTPSRSEGEDPDNKEMLNKTRTLCKSGVCSSSLSEPSTSSEAALVTNANRKQYVKDYIFWLTSKSIHPQYEAFSRGFYTCLDRTALSIFNPPAFKSVVEGSQHIDIDELQSITNYEDGFTADTPTILHFWDMVRSFPDEKKRGLLEFVTASDRVPVNGLGSIVFVIQRSGFDDRRLPTSMTCFGRLLLPQYSSREVLEEKLGKAIENAKGFGVA